LESRFVCGVAGFSGFTTPAEASGCKAAAVCIEQSRRIMFRILGVIAVGISTMSMAWSQAAAMRAEPTAQQKQIVADFEKRVNDYLALRKKVAGTSPAPTTSAEKLADTQKQLAAKIRNARNGAKQGEIFTPQISGYLRKEIAKTLQGTQGAKLRASLKHGEPARGVPVQVNGLYPPNVPLQSTPASLLMNLPPLPKELEYRIVNDDLVLHDTAANTIVDFLPHAVPGA
jgi:hypothetical protein